VTDMDARARKLADRIRVIVAQLLEQRVKDPRLGFVTITDARITNDLHDATVFYTVYGDEIEQQASQAALASATGMLRSEVGRITGVKFTPTLTFVADAIPENARHIEDLLRQAREADARVQARAAGASYAGDADPYKIDEETAEDELTPDPST
jgi:ribosome-binding factor A